MNRAHKISVCLATIYYHPVYSGAALRFRGYLSGFLKRGIDVTVFTGAATNLRYEDRRHTTPMNQIKDGMLFPIEYVDGIPVQRVKLPAGKMIKKYRVFSRSLVRYCKLPVRPDLVHFLSLSLASLPWLLFLKMINCPAIYSYTLMGKMSSRFWKRRLQRFYWMLPFKMVDCVVVGNLFMRKVLVEMGVKTPIKIIPHGVDLLRFMPIKSVDHRDTVRRRLSLNAGDEIVLFVGAIDPRKGVDILLKAAKILAPQRPRMKLLLAGPRHDICDPALAEFAKAIQNLIDCPVLKSRVLLTGKVDDIELYYGAADVFAFHSHREGMPNALLEAFACGLPCLVSSFIGLTDDYGQPGVHYDLVDRSPQQIANMINLLLDNPNRRSYLGSNAREWVEDHMDQEKVLDEYSTLYSEIARSNHNRKNCK